MSRHYPGLVGIGNIEDKRIARYFHIIDQQMRELAVAVGAAGPPGQGTGGAGGGPVSVTVNHVDEGEVISDSTEGFLMFGRGASDDIAYALEVDTTGRLNINPISGQAGVAAGSGASGVTTQRVIAATDSPEVTALQIIDDWDESDRAKTNPIVGQAGVQGGSGVVSANTQRVVLATDVALPAGTNNIGDVDILSLPDEGQQTMANSISVAIASNQSAVAVDSELPAADALADNVANPTTVIVGAYVHGRRQGGTTYDRVSNEVADSNTLGATDDRGIHSVDLVKYHRTGDLDNVNVAYDASPTSANSQTIDCSRFRKFLLCFTLDSTLAPTDIQFFIQFSQDGGTTWFDYRNDFWGQLIFDDVVCATAINRSYMGDCMGDDIRLRVVATGTDATNIFTVSNARIIFKN